MVEPRKSGSEAESPAEIAEGVYWVGFYDKQSGLNCNPYVVIDDEEAVVIDGGSRPDFSTVMMRILQAGIAPRQIQALIYQHYDPDLCGSISNFEDIIRRNDLLILSASENLMFIRHYSMQSPLVALSKIGFCYEFSSGRKLEFVKTPYSHSAGSFVTFDPKSGVLFTSDLFGSYSLDWDLYLNLLPECFECENLANCRISPSYCPINGIFQFHKKIMTSTAALRFSLEQISKIPFRMIAPQHGSIIKDKKTIQYVFERLVALDEIGIDGVIASGHTFDYTNFRKRF